MEATKISTSNSKERNELGYKLIEKLLSDQKAREDKEKRRKDVLLSAILSETKGKKIILSNSK